MTTQQKPLHFVGVNSCLGAQDQGCSTGPMAVRHAGIEQAFESRRRTQWHNLIVANNPKLDKSGLIHNICEQLADCCEKIAQSDEEFVVIGGDHSCAIGTWSGVARAHPGERIGLVWIDAHMDSHLPETSPSEAIHGMPLACLLGHGEKRFRNLAHQEPVLLPQDVCLLGIRSYEPEEKALLDLLGVHVFYMEDVLTLGLHETFTRAWKIATEHTARAGISIDLDAIDPQDAPGVGSPEHNGINATELLSLLSSLKGQPKLTGLEIAELNPARDIDHKTTELCIALAKAVY